MESCNRGGLSCNRAGQSRGCGALSCNRALEVAELNGPVDVRGVTVHPGDVLVADRDGVAVIPVDLVERVVDHCERGQRDEQALIALIDRADGLEDLVARTAGGATPT